jgi:hypothetical protein
MNALSAPVPPLMEAMIRTRVSVDFAASQIILKSILIGNKVSLAGSILQNLQVNKR